MVATANEVARSCSQAASSADAGYRDVHDGQQHIGEATGSVLKLSEDLQKSTQTMQALEQDSKNINTILDTIRTIAEQTNLLALNAAIEAARAGAKGQIGSASCRERVCSYVEIAVDAGTIKKRK